MHHLRNVPVFVSASVILGAAMTGFAVGTCCVANSSWQGESPCTGDSTAWCEDASSSAVVGKKFPLSSSPALCFSVTLDGGVFVQQACNVPPSNGTRIGPPLSEGICCFVVGGHETAFAFQNFNIMHCTSENCVD